MDYSRKVRRVKPEISSLQETYPHDLQLYTQPPTGDINLLEFQELALERLKLLRIVEIACRRTDIQYDMILPTIVSELRNEKNLGYYKTLLQSNGYGPDNELELKARRKDHIAHFILQLAHSKDAEIQRWFVSRETELFKLRYLNLNAEGIRRFLKVNKLDYSPISQDEKESIRSILSDSTASCSESYVDFRDFYKVPHEEVPDLVKNRRVYLKKGYAYIPDKDLVSVFVTLFKTQLSAALAYTKRGLPVLSTDERICKLLKQLRTSSTNKDFTTCNTAAIPIESLDALSRTSYPLCMRHIHESLCTNHHVKHYARLQYTLFLKGIGVLLDHAIKFWRTEFCKKIDVEQFNKRYLYAIRHSYGKEGKRTNYTPFSCLKIIQSTPGPGEVHGCLFKEIENGLLRKTLLNYGIHSGAVHEIADLAKGAHYQIACSKYFEAIHKSPPASAVMHPNEYFRNSQDIINEKQTGQVKPNAKSVPGVSKVDKRAIEEIENMDISAEIWDVPMNL